ncbi:MAG: VPLPA-CTERM sorting domain-containing protein [Gammaproteobacteria bacterium]|nr:MAG: VPLPA-CTERM sorting domain-containing protein [Gammaproteobacteria bacterium]
MSFKSARRHLFAVAALALLGGTAQAATTYQLTSMTFKTSSAPGTYTFGSGPLAASACLTCGSSTAIDDGMGNLTVNTVSYKLANFGADIIHTFSGTTTLGASTTLIKNAGETCVEGTAGPPSSPHLCTSTDIRAWTGDWYNGFMADGVTPSATAQFSAVVTGSNLALRVRKSRDNPESLAWLEITYNYQAVPVPAAVWLMGGALGALGVARRRQRNS